MTVEHIIEILKTRLKASDQTGNYTEKSLLIELLKMAEEYKQLKENKGAKEYE